MRTRKSSRQLPGTDGRCFVISLGSTRIIVATLTIFCNVILGDRNLKRAPLKSSSFHNYEYIFINGFNVSATAVFARFL